MHRVWSRSMGEPSALLSSPDHAPVVVPSARSCDDRAGLSTVSRFIPDATPGVAELGLAKQ
jgi:hypothetical protein